MMEDFNLEESIPFAMMVFTTASMWMNLLRWVPTEEPARSNVIISITASTLMGTTGVIGFALSLSAFPNLTDFIVAIGLPSQWGPMSYYIIGIFSMQIGYSLSPLVIRVLFADVNFKFLDKEKDDDLFMAGILTMLWMSLTWLFGPISTFYSEHRWPAFLASNFLWISVSNHFLLFRRSPILSRETPDRVGSAIFIISMPIVLAGSMLILNDWWFAPSGYIILVFGLMILILGYWYLSKRDTVEIELPIYTPEGLDPESKERIEYKSSTSIIYVCSCGKVYTSKRWFDKHTAECEKFSENPSKAKSKIVNHESQSK
jgi:hypothetical protein